VAEAQGESTISLSSADTLYLFEFYMIFKVGGTASPYATIEWPGVQIPQALTTILKDKGIKSHSLTTRENSKRPPYTFTKGAQPDEEWTSTRIRIRNPTF
jgi:hypothetical protein